MVCTFTDTEPFLLVVDLVTMIMYEHASSHAENRISAIHLLTWYVR